MTAERERLADIVHVLHGERGTGAAQRIVYGVYVTVLLVSTYGFTLARALFATREPATLRHELLSLPALAVALAVIAVLLTLARLTGRTRGPVVPPLPWADHVVTSSLDRALALRQWWRYAAAGGLAGGVVLGAAVGGGAWSGGVGGPRWLVVGVLAGPALGWSVVIAWLSGQVAAGPGPVGSAGSAPGAGAGRPTRPAAALRRLGIDELRRHSARSARIGGGMLAGDLRAVRLEVAAPVSHGRSLRLRSAGPWWTVVRRDVLGLRRGRGTVAAGAAVTALGAAGVTWALDDPAAPSAITWLAVVGCYLGFGWWAEGLRLQGDNGGTTPMLGVWGRREALAHLVAPSALFAVVAGVMALTVGTVVSPGATGAGAARTGFAGSALAPAGWLVVLLLGVAGAQLLAAFRGRPPLMAFLPESGPMLLALWFARPIVVAVVGGGGLTALASSRGLGPGLAVVAAAGALLTVWWGLSRVDALESAHRE